MEDKNNFEEGIDITCPNCNYSWKTISKMIFVNCPSCRKQCKREDNIKHEK